VLEPPLQTGIVLWAHIRHRMPHALIYTAYLTYNIGCYDVCFVSMMKNTKSIRRVTVCLMYRPIRGPASDEH